MLEVRGGFHFNGSASDNFYVAVYNELQSGRFNRLLQKLTGIKGGAPVKQLGSEILPVFGIPLGNETRYLESWDLFGAAVSVSAVAANQSGIRLRNPSNSNVVAVFTKILIATGATTSGISVQGGVASGDVATIVGTPNARLDARTRPSPTLIASTQNNAVSFPLLNNGIALLTGIANTMFDLIIYEYQEIPLLPGDAIQLFDQTANDSLTVSFMWRERFLEDSERS
jgi:hypothetical protein